jgi:hypothetical protein
MDYIIREKKSQPQSRRYFTKETEVAIVRYNNSEDFDERSNIYQEYIHWPFYKLTENIIHTFKFYHTEVENLEDLQHEIMTFLLDKIHLFDPAKGAKAYSYFGTIVKRWLIVYNQKNYKKKLSNIPILDLSNYSNLDTSDPDFISSKRMDNEVSSLIETEDHLDDDELGMQGYKHQDKLSWFMDQYVDYCTEHIFDIFNKEYDAQIADAILELFRKRDAIDVFNKKALYIYIREQVDVKTPKITKIANVLYDIFKDKYLYYLEHGKFLS